MAKNIVAKKVVTLQPQKYLYQIIKIKRHGTTKRPDDFIQFYQYAFKR